eukprot:c292_g1_i1.p1 GENE.c292_g1_i1~~c292_g1_i1.p1  ORF type:complete len:231 (+),score=56.22 c292_g1_i1:37-729(+)
MASDYPGELTKLQNAYTKAQPDHRFKFVFYNEGNPQEYQPSGDPILLRHAIQNNPDPSRLVPVQAAGAEEVKIHVDGQKGLIQTHDGVLRKIGERLDEIKRNLETTVQQKLETQQRRHGDLTQRLIRVVGKLEVWQGMDRPMMMEELTLRAKLEELYVAMNRPQIRGRLEEIEAAVQMDDGWLAGDQYVIEGDQIEQLSQALAEQQRGIQQLLNILQKDLQDMEKIRTEP